MKEAESSVTRKPSLVDALIPVLSLIFMLAMSVYLYGEDSSYGANQIALLLATGIAAIVGIKNGYSWKEIETGIANGVAISVGALLILLTVGSLIATWILSGTVPTLIFFGLQWINPAIFYPVTCVICALVALSIGSSWTVAGTLGIALMGVASAMNLSPAVTAGAVISGAYFGDKMSPLSDTTNLAPAVAGSELFTHIRHMMWTTLPSFALALIAFSVVSLNSDAAESGTDLEVFMEVLQTQFSLGWHLLLPLVLVVFLAFKKFPAFPTMLIGALVGGVFAVLFQPDTVREFVNRPDMSTGMVMLSGVWTALFDGYVSNTGNTTVDELLSRGGMSSMLLTVWLIICAMAFGAILEKTGILLRLLETALKAVNSTASLIITTLLTTFGTNVIAADQYIAIVLPGRLYRLEFQRRGLAPVNLSRALEDAGTITSALIPWNTCGAYMASTLGVATLTYLPFAFFNYINPLMAAIYAYLGLKIERIDPEDVLVPAGAD